jgi:hypothetical protein
MADDLKTLDMVRQKGKIFLNNPILFGAHVLYVARGGVGMVLISSGIPANQREVAFGTAPSIGVFRFYNAAEQNENIHIIYKPGTGLSIFV